MAKKFSLTSLLVGFCVTVTVVCILLTIRTYGLDRITHYDVYVEPVSNSVKYEQLNTIERSIYDQLLEQVPGGDLTVFFWNADYDTYCEAADRAVTAFVCDHPEFFWLSSGFRASGIPASLLYPGHIFIELDTYEFWAEIDDHQTYADRLLQAVDAVAETARKYDTAYEQVKFVHDYLADTARYDSEALQNTKEPDPDSENYYIFTAYGCLINGRSVCAGYVRAFQMVLHRLGIPCSYENGVAGDESHAWNMVELDGEAYYVDVTWDDTQRYDGDGDAYYTYFLVTSAMLEQDHIPDETLFEAPDCTATQYNYFHREGYYVETYSQSAVDQILADQKEKNILAVRFSDNQEMEQLVDDLKNGHWGGITTLREIEVQYQANANCSIVTFFKKTE